VVIKRQGNENKIIIIIKLGATPFKFRNGVYFRVPPPGLEGSPGRHSSVVNTNAVSPSCHNTDSRGSSAGADKKMKLIGLQCESKNPPSCGFLTFFPNKWEFLINFTNLLYVPFYTTNFYSIISNFDEVMPY